MTDNGTPALAYLGVSTSITGRPWRGPTAAEDRAAEALVQTTRLPLPVARVLAHRGIAPDEAESFLSPTLRDLLPDPLTLRDMGKAAERILKAVAAGERIAIFADYDVDGATSGALLHLWLRDMGREATLYVPDRIDEGYGPNEPAMAALAKGHSLIVCVDCGTLSHDPIAAAGCDVIVLDHHLGGETLPDCVAVVNPNRQDESGDLGHLCAAGVVFLMLVEANRQMKASGAAGPDLMSALDLVALGTVADVAPLIGVNRAFVRQGLTVMGRRGRIGITALSDVAGMNEAPNSYHLGFLLGPRVNAGGRIGKADLGARLLATVDRNEASALADMLDQLNTERREVESAVRDLAIEQAEARGYDAPLVWAAGKNWHPGVVGIVASRLKDASNRPSVVIGIDEDGTGKGSGRSVTGIDLGAAIQRLASEGLLIKGGGHKMAAGLSVEGDKIEAAMARLGELLAKQGSDKIGPADLKLDGVLMPAAATVELVNQIEQAGPFGAGAPAPRFVFPDVQILFAKTVGANHLKITFGDGLGKRIDSISFGAMDGPLGPMLTNHNCARFHLAGRLEINTWQGRQSVQLRLEDAAPAA